MTERTNRPERTHRPDSGPPRNLDKEKLPEHPLPGREQDGGESLLSGRSREDHPQDAADAELPPAEKAESPEEEA